MAVDTGELLAEYHKQWAVLVDKGYQRSVELVREVHPKKDQEWRVVTII